MIGSDICIPDTDILEIGGLERNTWVHVRGGDHLVAAPQGQTGDVVQQHGIPALGRGGRQVPLGVGLDGVLPLPAMLGADGVEHGREGIDVHAVPTGDGEHMPHGQAPATVLITPAWRRR